MDGVERASNGPGPARRAPLLPPSTRRPAVAAVAVCVAVVASLGAAFAHQSQPDRLDRAVDGWIQSVLAGHSVLLHRVIYLGEPVPVTVLTVALVLACLAARNWRGAALVTIAVPAAEVITEFLLKPLVGRTIGGGGFSFPSGHTTGVFVLANCFALLLAARGWPGIPVRLRLALALTTYAVASIVAVCLVAVSFHYFTDTIGGVAVATGTVLSTALTVDKLDGRPARVRRSLRLAVDRLTATGADRLSATGADRLSATGADRLSATGADRLSATERKG
jgi:membrane-associated phospholipid phosphatase